MKVEKLNSLIGIMDCLCLVIPCLLSGDVVESALFIVVAGFILSFEFAVLVFLDEFHEFGVTPIIEITKNLTFICILYTRIISVHVRVDLLCTRTWRSRE